MSEDFSQLIAVKNLRRMLKEVNEEIKTIKERLKKLEEKGDIIQ